MRPFVRFYNSRLQVFTQSLGKGASAKYLPEIDGLRGVSVLLVLAFHFDISGFEGGYLGVDAFFVISGYLITGILLSEIEKKSFSYSKFLSRRANRLLPALGLMSLLTAVLAWHIYSTGVLSRFSDSLIGVATYTSNFVFLFDGGYFEQSNATTPLLHTWSLSVEEQFYLIFPLLILAMHRLNVGNLFRVVLVLSTLSVMAYVYLLDFQSNENLQEFAFFMLPTRAWELGAGSILAIHFWNRERATKPLATKPTNTLSIAGAASLIVSLIVGATYSHRGIASSFMVLAIVLLIANSDSTIIGKFLRNSMLVKLGLMSYGLYLYHFPILAAFKLFSGTNDLDLGSKVIAAVLTLSMSVVSLRFLENPIRYGALKKRTSGLLATAFILVLLGIAFLSKVPAQEISPEVSAAEVLKGNRYTYFNDLDERLFQKSRLAVAGSDFEGDTIVVGSSRVMLVNSETSGEEILNLSVSGATVEDLYSFGLPGLKVSGETRVIIGLDPWVVNKHSKEIRWKSVETDYKYWREVVVKGIPLRSFPYPESLGQDNQLSLISNLYNQFNAKHISQIPSDGIPEILAKKSQDGSIIYGLEYQNMSIEEIRAGFSSIHSYAEMPLFELSDRKLESIRDLIIYLKANSIAVEIVLTPYHPELYPELVSKSIGYETAERVFIELANQQGIVISGSYNPQQAGCKSHEFYDGMHPKEECMSRVLQSRGTN